MSTTAQQGKSFDTYRNGMTHEDLRAQVFYNELGRVSKNTIQKLLMTIVTSLDEWAKEHRN